MVSPATILAACDGQPAGRPFEPGLCLSRFRDEGNYSPENTRWITRSQNSSETTASNWAGSNPSAGQGTYGPCECRRTEPYPDADVIEMRWA